MQCKLKPEIGSIAVQCRGIVKYLGKGALGSRVLSGVDLDVRTGEMTLLVGPSGCGKTTLISIMAGILSPDSGVVEAFGTRVSDLRGAAASRFRAAHIGMIMQQLNLLPALTAVENAALPLLAQGHSQSSAQVRAVKLLRELELGEHLVKYPTEMSVGQQQRVAVARALVHEPQLVLCDEPTAALDTASGIGVMRLLRGAARRSDCAVIVVTHDQRILPFGDRIVRMSDGRVSEVDPINMEAA